MFACKLSGGKKTNDMHVPDARHDGVAPGGAKGVSMGSAAVPMRTKGKHDLVLRIAD
jgi:hypothetical protein